MYSPMCLYPEPPSHSILLSVVCEKLAYATVPGLLNRKEVEGKRFCKRVREVLNLMEAVVNVESVAFLASPVKVWRGPGKGPNEMGILQ